jgi:prolyl oligopeptidase
MNRRPATVPGFPCPSANSRILTGRIKSAARTAPASGRFRRSSIDIYGAALPAVGVMDMLRFHKFTIGWAWADDYGSSENTEQFNDLHKYSLLHNIKPGTSYPPTLVTTADHDDRVVPAHSFKFAATLQAAQTGDNPTLIRIETRAGHGAGKPTGKIIEEAADRYAFLVKVLRID